MIRSRHKELVLQVLYKDLATNAAHRRASYVVEAALNNCAPQAGVGWAGWAGWAGAGGGWMQGVGESNL